VLNHSVLSCIQNAGKTQRGAEVALVVDHAKANLFFMHRQSDPSHN